MHRSLAPALVLALLFVACRPSDTESTRMPKGNPSASIVIEEYADLQCPACRSAHTTINAPILEEYGDRIRFDFKHFPLRAIHHYALDLGEASECAADQGKFWEFVDHAFAQQDQLDAGVIEAWGAVLGLDAAAFESCIRSHRKRDLVLADYEEGRERGVGGTPTYFINGQRVEATLATIKAAIDAALEAQTSRL